MTPRPSLGRPAETVPGIRTLRLRAGLTLAQAGRRAGCTGGHLSHVERGHQRLSDGLAGALAAVYGVSIARFHTEYEKTLRATRKERGR